MRIVIGEGSCGIAAGAQKVRSALEALIDQPIGSTGCIGMCYLEPIVDLYEGKELLRRLVRVSDKDAEAIAEACRCLKCGCGEGCQLCKTICTDFAPEISGVDTVHIRKEECVACGMCFNRCPNGNIEMVNLGYTV